MILLYCGFIDWDIIRPQRSEKIDDMDVTCVNQLFTDSKVICITSFFCTFWVFMLQITG
jgi:hypothetical protein